MQCSLHKESFWQTLLLLKIRSFLFLETNSQNVNDVIKLFSKYDLRKSLRISEATDIKTYCILYNDLPLDIQVQLKKFKIIKNDNFFIFSDPRKNEYLARVWVNKKNIKNIPKYISLKDSTKII